MTFVYGLDPYALEMYRMCKNETSYANYRLTDKQTGIHRQTDALESRNYTPRRFVSGQQK